MTNQHTRPARGIDRRTVLKSAVSVTGAGVFGVSAFGGTAIGQEEPCFEEFGSCDPGATYVRFDLVEEDGVCSFEEVTDTDVLRITNVEYMDGDECRPLAVAWESDIGDVSRVMAFGGTDCDVLENPGGSYNADRSGDAGLDTEDGDTESIENLQFCVAPLELPVPVEDVYIGYEDRPASGDFDFNDFGMNAQLRETYPDGTLSTIDMEFTSRFNEASDSHDIHIQRTFDSSVDWEVTVERPNHTAAGNELAAGTYTGAGTLQAVLFDTNEFSQGNTVTLTVSITSGSVTPPTDSPREDVAANNGLFEVYDPWMNNKSQGTIIDMTTVQENVDKDEADWDGPSDVPNIVVVPVTPFTPSNEGVTITTDYPEFDDYYRDVDDDGDVDPDPAFDDWYETS